MRIQQNILGFQCHIYVIAYALQQVAFENFSVLLAKVGFSIYYELKNKKNYLTLTVHSELEVELQVSLVQVNLLLLKRGRPTCFFPCPFSPLLGMNRKECVGSNIGPVTGQSIVACDLSRKTLLAFGVLSGFSDGLEG